MLTVVCTISGLACGGSSGGDGGSDGGADGGLGGLDGARVPGEAGGSAIDQSLSGLDQAQSPIDGLGAIDAPLVADAPVSTDGPVLALDHLMFGPSGTVTVTYSRAPDNTSAWMGFYAAAAADGDYMANQPTGGKVSGSLTFTIPETKGTYNIRLFGDGGYTKIATSASFTVSYPYDLDPGFATAGRLSFDFLGNGLMDGACAVIPLAGGKIVLAGTAKTGTKDTSGWEQNEFAVAQLNADGSFDATFGTGGRVHAGPTTHSLAGCTASVVQKDGKILVGGWGHGRGDFGTVGTDYVLARFTSAGVLDATFGTGGFVTTNFKAAPASSGENDKLLSLTLLTDGRILAGGEMMLAAGSYNNGRPSFARYTTAGALDTTFGGTGMVTIDPAAMTPPGGQTVFDVNAQVVTATGATYAGLTAISGFGRNDTAIALLRPDGSLDTTFGLGGVAWETKPGVHNDQHLSQIMLTPTGSLVMLGHGLWAWFIGRYTAAGDADTAFGTSGQGVGDFSSSWDLPAGMVMLADGSFLVGLSPDSADGASMSGNLGLVHHDPLGKIDSAFGKSRWKWTVGAATLASRATSFAMQADGKLLLAGLVEKPGGNLDFAVMRLAKTPGW